MSRFTKLNIQPEKTNNDKVYIDLCDNDMDQSKD